MFTPFFLNRRKQSQMLAGLFGNEYHNESHPKLHQITQIQPETLHLVPCKKPTLITMLPGIPFDIYAVITMLIERKKSLVLDHILKQVQGTITEENPLVIFCSGSKINGNIPFITITPHKGEDIKIGIVPPNCKNCAKNGYHLVYNAAA